MDVNGVELHVETTGDPAAPAILLLAGMGSPLDWWDDEFCQQLAAGGRFVIRYDHRDTGESVSYPVGEPGYTGADLLADAIGVLDALGVDRAHVAGVSMGGALAQRLAVEYPDRVASLVLIATRLIEAPPGAPPPSAEILAFLTAPPAPPDWSDRTATVDFIVDMQRRYMTPEHFDEDAVRHTAERIVRRTRNMAASMINHRALVNDAAPVDPGPAKVPALIIHGTADPLFPYPHAEALAEAFSGAEVVPLPGVGHQLPPPESWPVVVPAILRHTAPA